MQLSKKLKNFCHFFSPFLKSASYFKYFEDEKMTLIAYVFPKLQITKEMVSPMFK